ncbi:hypothetical protein [Sphingomonas alba]|uniref:Uncharacterized protein n=1 Tax=Sphingomonas alba TaxID=2908208 RepID=A0ABT0RNT9_9SPHN|nr:hypothetical protein [Sphingomonas alba]MCL6684321.1 hypothetical protein [Sphingomonas alba]
MRTRTKLLLGVAAALAVAIPAIAQDQPESLLPPGFGEPAPAPSPTTVSPGNTTAPTGGSETAVEMVPMDQALADLLPDNVPPPVELPASARRDPSLAGPLPSSQTGFERDAWGRASGKFLSILLRRTHAPLPSRWAHITVRNALLTQIPAPTDVNAADWAAERAWLLLRMGEADGARMLVSAVDVDDFTPKMYQVAVQSALANADPSGLCPLQDGLGTVERLSLPLIRAICASLSGASAEAAADIEDARRHGRIGGIDLALADKVVGAGADTSRAATIEWAQANSLTAWRFGLATSTGMLPPQDLIDTASPQVRAWQARAPVLGPESRLASARIATGLGVFSSQALMDLYSVIYDGTDPSDLGQTDAWQLRVAMVGKDQETRLAAMRKLWSAAKPGLDTEAARAVLARAASRVAPSKDLEADAPNLIASMLAAGYDVQAARWASVVDDMGDANADKCWAMLALGAPSARGLDISSGRIGSFIGRDNSPGKQRSALLVAGLAGLGRIDGRTAGRLSDRYGLGLSRRTSWSNLIDAASIRRQAATVAVLAGIGMQTNSFEGVPGMHMFHAVTALRRNGQEFAARMIAAEALSRT